MKEKRFNYCIGLFKRGKEWLILFWTIFFKVIIYSRNKFAANILLHVDHKLSYALVFLPPELYGRK